MSKVAIVSDSNSGITQLQAEELGITILPMPFFVGDKTLYEDIDLSQKEFYQMLSENANISTSMPLVGNVTDTWDALLKEYDEIVHIPMSSGLSGSCETALMLAQDYEGKVQVVNNQRISVTQRQSVLDAMALAEQGRSAVEIKEILERDKFESSIYIMVDTLYYLKKGGRITPAAAEGKSMHLEMAYTYDLDAAEAFRQEVQEAFPGLEIHMDPLSLSVSCHIGPGALAVACSKKIPELEA